MEFHFALELRSLKWPSFHPSHHQGIHFSPGYMSANTTKNLVIKQSGQPTFPRSCEWPYKHPHSTRPIGAFNLAQALWAPTPLSTCRSYYQGIRLCPSVTSTHTIVTCSLVHAGQTKRPWWDESMKAHYHVHTLTQGQKRREEISEMYGSRPWKCVPVLGVARACWAKEDKNLNK